MQNSWHRNPPVQHWVEEIHQRALTIASKKFIRKIT
jgi:hypothetical protein